MDCGKQFKGIRGLSIHSRSAHAELYHARKTLEISEAIRDQTKTRWDPEELAGMAKEEARLRKRCIKGVNKALRDFMSGRTLEAIRGQRRSPNYRAMVDSYMSVDHRGDEAVIPPRVQATLVAGGTTPGPHSYTEA
ncbi:MAG: hypothetical protein M3H12_03580, partial [Chromatiales bacterium]